MKRLCIALFCTVFLCSCNDVSENKSLSPADIDFQTDDPEIKFDLTEYRKISAAEALEMMDAEENFILLDVRTDAEYKEQRLKGAILIPNYEITERASFDISDKNALILIYCRSGRRSEIAAKELINMGYTNVYDFGGIIDWPYETISD